MNRVGEIVATVQGRGQRAGEAKNQRPQRIAAARRRKAHVEAEQGARAEDATGEKKESAQTGAEVGRRLADQHE